MFTLQDDEGTDAECRHCVEAGLVITRQDKEEFAYSIYTVYTTAPVLTTTTSVSTNDNELRTGYDMSTTLPEWLRTSNCDCTASTVRMPFSEWSTDSDYTWNRGETNMLALGPTPDHTLCAQSPSGTSGSSNGHVTLPGGSLLYKLDGKWQLKNPYVEELAPIDVESMSLLPSQTT